MRKSVYACLTAAFLLTQCATAFAENWPQFRGPDGNGISQEAGLPTEWSTERNILWKTRLPGPGASSPITWGNRVYLTCYSGYGDGTAGGTANDIKRHLVCVNLNNGRTLWTAAMPSRSRDFDYVNYVNKHGYASSTPAADEDRVYVFYGASGAAAYDHEGDLQWHTSCGTGVHEFGSASSPVLFKDLVILNANIECEAIVALDRKTGEERWRHPAVITPQRGRSTPLLLRAGERDELVFHNRLGGMAALNPNSGELLWHCESVDRYHNPKPVSADGIVYAIGGSMLSALAVRAGGRGDVTNTHRLWQINQGSRVSSPVLHNGYLYWVREAEGIAGCFEAKTGKTVYLERLQPRPGEIYASPVLADGKIYYVSRENGTYVLPAKPEFQLLAHNTIETDGSIFNGSPAVSHGCLLLRSDKYLYCVGAKR